MISTRRITLFAVLAATLAGCGISTSNPLVAGAGSALKAQDSGAAWGMYNYFAMDNDLDRGPSAINSLTRVAAPSVVTSNLWDGAQQGDTQLFFQTLPGGKFQAGPKTEYDTGTAQALDKFMAEATANSPARQRVLTMADHGGGIVRGICSDWNGPGGKKIIHLNEVASVLSKYPVDVLNFDACFMNMIEVAYEVRKVAKFVTGAQTTTYAGDFSYQAALKGIETSKASARDVAVALTEVGTQYSRKSHSYSAVDTGKSEAVAGAVRNLAKVMQAKMPTLKDKMRQTIAESQSYAAEENPRLAMYNNYRDLGDIADNLAKLGDPELTQAAKAVRAASAEAVVIERHKTMYQTPPMERTSGMMVYASTDGTVEQGYLNRSFSRETGWGDMLVKLNSRSGWANPVQKDKYPHEFPSRIK